MNYILFKKQLFVLFNKTVIPFSIFSGCHDFNGNVNVDALYSTLISAQSVLLDGSDEVVISELKPQQIAISSFAGAIENDVQLSILIAFSLLVNELAMNQYDVAISNTKKAISLTYKNLGVNQYYKFKAYDKFLNYVMYQGLAMNVYDLTNCDVKTSLAMSACVSGNEGTNSIDSSLVESLIFKLNSLDANFGENTLGISMGSTLEFYLNSKSNQMYNLANSKISKSLASNYTGKGFDNKSIVAFAMKGKTLLKDLDSALLSELDSISLSNIEYTIN